MIEEVIKKYTQKKADGVREREQTLGSAIETRRGMRQRQSIDSRTGVNAQRAHRAARAERGKN